MHVLLMSLSSAWKKTRPEQSCILLWKCWYDLVLPSTSGVQKGKKLCRTAMLLWT